MTDKDLLILTIALIITGSGLWINIQKSGHKSEKATPDQQDRGSLSLFRWAVPVALLGSLGLYFWQGPLLLESTFPFPLGLGLVGLGLGIRWYAVWQLGKAFTVQLQVADQQKLSTDGIFKYLRHPSYTGLMLYYIGLGLIMSNALCLSILIALPLWAVLNRIGLEEKLLLSHFGETYAAYQQRTWRLMPWVY